jgi:HEPN domain-containing protein
MRPEDLEIADSWMSKADGDARAIEILMRDPDPPWDIVAFHAQQLAEKSLKALLAAIAVPFPRTHDLSVLLLKSAGAIAMEGNSPAVVELSQMAVAPRYPEFPEPVDGPAALRAIETARDIANRVRMRLQIDRG